MATDGTTEEVDVEPAEPRVAGFAGRIEAVQTLGLRSFRFYLFSNLVFFFGQQMQLVARQWLLMGLTPSRVLLGMIGFSQGLAVLILSLLGGVVADRLARRHLLMAGQAGQLAVAIAMAALVTTHSVQIWHIIAASLAIGLFLAFSQPATQTFVFDLVGKRRLMNALAMNSAASSLSQMGGPALAGLLIAAIGVAGTYWASSGGYMMAILMLAAIPIAGRTATRRSGSLRTEIAEGFREVRKNEAVLWLLGFAAVSTFGAALFALRPVYAKEILKVGPTGLGEMGAAWGAGSIAGAILVASLGNIRRKGLTVIFSGLAWYGSMMVYAFSRSFPLTLALEVILGFSTMFWSPSVMTAIQSCVAEEMRGRVLSIYFMCIQGVSLGHLLAGVLADRFSDTTAMAFGAAVGLSFHVYVLLRSPVMRKL
ncbi:MAG: MFS transporter [Chloroflexi bacterium]|nr:MFS transporter [Chloroflexota bacterium]